MRAFVAVVVGYLVWSVLWLGGGAGLHSVWPAELSEEGPWSAPVPLVALLGLSVVCSLVAGFVTRRLAPRGRALLVMALLLLVTGIGVQASVWDKFPLWFNVLFLGLIVPMCRLGAGRAKA